MTETIATPPEPRNQQGEIRRVGVEIEFAGLTVPDVSGLVRERLGGRLHEISPHRHRIEDTPFGPFTIELDARMVHGADPKNTGANEDVGTDGSGGFETKLREVVGDAVTGLVPVEVVSPPIPWNELDRLNGLFEDLRARDAEGTEDHLLNSFGLHLNPEVACQEVDYLLAHFRAFLILSEWLRAAVEVDLTRRLLPHIDPFPRSYVRTVVDPGYRPDMAHLIDDYIAANPTRNRELDLLPLFRFIDEDRVTRRLDGELIKARPTFHYRLPNCSLSIPDWNAVVEWNRWVKVEALAADQERLARAGEAYRRHLSGPADPRWWEDLKDWLLR